MDMMFLIVRIAECSSKKSKAKSVARISSFSYIFYQNIICIKESCPRSRAICITLEFERNSETCFFIYQFKRGILDNKHRDSRFPTPSIIGSSLKLCGILL